MKHYRVKANEIVKVLPTMIPICGRLGIWRLEDAVKPAHEQLRRFLNQQLVEKED